MGLVSGAVAITLCVIIMAWCWRAWEDKRHDRLVEYIVQTLDRSNAKDRAKLDIYEKKVDAQHKELVRLWSELDKCRSDCAVELAVIKAKLEGAGLAI